MDSTTTRNWVLGGVLGATAVAGLWVGTRKPTEERVTPPTTQSEISISTKDAVPLTFQFSTATVDMQYGKNQRQGFFDVDMADPNFIAKQKAFGFNRTICFADGSITNNAYPFINPTTSGKGYNARRSDFGTQKEFDEAMGGILAATTITKDFFSVTVDFCKAVGIPMDVALNKKETWAESKYKIERSTGEYVLLNSETVSYKNADGNAWTPAQYITWAKKTIDSIRKYFPTKRVVVDQALLYKNNRQSLDWRQQITPTTLTGVWGADVYWQLDDQLNYTANQDSNMLKTTRFFDSIVPAQIAQFQREFPGWKIFAGECLIEDRREGNIIYVNNNMSEVFSWFYYYKMFIENQAIQPIAIQMSLKNLQNPTDSRSQTIPMLNKLFQGSNKVTDVTFTNMTGLDGVGVMSSANPTKHTLLIANTSPNTYTIQNIKLNGKTHSTLFQVQRQYGASYSSTPTRDSVTSTTLTILPISLNVVTFTK